MRTGTDIHDQWQGRHPCPSALARYLFGFTLIELLVVVAIVAILSKLAAPSLTAILQANTVKGAVNSFLTDMRFARSEALRRGGHVVMCKSNTPDSAGADCNTGPDWASGWIVFYDPNGNRSFDTVSSQDKLLHVQGSLSALGKILLNGNDTSKFEFGATGRVNLARSVTFGDSALLASEQQRVVCVSMSGMARIALDAQGHFSGDARCE